MRLNNHELRRSAAGALDKVIGAGTDLYERKRHLRRLLPQASEDFRNEDAETTRAILMRLAAAMRAERRRGRAGHWTYDLNRHIALAQAFRAEKEGLRKLSGGGA